jgi:hypothetical protein
MGHPCLLAGHPFSAEIERKRGLSQRWSLAANNPANAAQAIEAAHGRHNACVAARRQAQTDPDTAWWANVVTKSPSRRPGTSRFDRISILELKEH